MGRENSTQDEWFAAVARRDTRTMGLLLLRGVDIDMRDAHGRTALFYAVVPDGGAPEVVKWLVDRGADVHVRDRDGIDVLAWGSARIASGLEANKLAFVGDILKRRGPERQLPQRKTREKAPPGPPVRAEGARAAPAPAEVTPPAPSATPTVEDFLGKWVISGGPAAGHTLDVRTSGIRTAYLPFRLAHAKGGIVGAAFELDGDHMGLEVHLVLRLEPGGGATLTWNDGVTFAATCRLLRPGIKGD